MFKSSGYSAKGSIVIMPATSEIDFAEAEIVQLYLSFQLSPKK
jgi:hypothetical protein